MHGFIDIHCHILPGVDDGPCDMDEVCRMLSIASEEGIQIIVATPHYSTDSRKVPVDKLKKLMEEISITSRNAGFNIDFALGNELLYSMDLMDAINKGEALTIDGTRYILVEFLPDISIQEIKNGLNNCIYSGYIPVLAHAERYQCLRKDVKVVGDIVQMGTYIQINMSSISACVLDAKARFSHTLIKKGWVHFLGTDAHGSCQRPPNMSKAVEFIAKKAGEETIDRLLWENPLTMLEDKHL